MVFNSIFNIFLLNSLLLKKAASGSYLPVFCSVASCLCSHNHCTEQAEVGTQAPPSCSNFWYLLCHVQFFK